MNDMPMLARLHELLDRGVDPLDDEELVEWLEQHPEQLPLAVALRADARDLHDAAVVATGAQSRRRRHLALATSLAALAAAAFVLAVWPAPETPAQPRIVASSFEELRPRAHLAATFVVHDSLVTTGRACLESYTLRSERR
jgi:hypothetical protein